MLPKPQLREEKAERAKGSVAGSAGPEFHLIRKDMERKVLRVGVRMGRRGAGNSQSTPEPRK